MPFRRISPYAALPAAGAAILAVGVLALPWLGERWANDALGAAPARAVTLADRAESVDPLLVDPLWAKAFAAEAQGRSQRAFDFYVRAVHRQPKNPQTWRLAGLYAYQQRCYRLAYEYLEKYTELDNKAKPSQGGAAYNRALTIVNSGKAKC